MSDINTPPPSPASSTSTINLFIGGEDSMETHPGDIVTPPTSPQPSTSDLQQQPTTSICEDDPLDLLDGATPEDVEILQDLLSDADMKRFSLYLKKQVLWNTEAFVEKVGFAKKENAMKNAKSKNLIRHDINIKKAVGLTEIDGIPIINPVPADTPIPARSNTRIKYMGTWDLLEWIGGASTDRGVQVRRALWWLFFTADENKYQKKVGIFFA